MVKLREVGLYIESHVFNKVHEFMGHQSIGSKGIEKQKLVWIKKLANVLSTITSTSVKTILVNAETNN